VLAIRFRTGLGRGGAMPNACHDVRIQRLNPRGAGAQTLVMIMFCGFSVRRSARRLLAAGIDSAISWVLRLFGVGMALRL